MKQFLVALLLATQATAFALDGEWEAAKPGWRYEFPRDHHVHNEFKTEWWYFTWNVVDDEGHRFGYELTFFRQGITPPAGREADVSRFVVHDLKFAHFAVTDVARKQFRFEQKTSRGAFGEAGFDSGLQLAWIDDWTLAANGDDAFDLIASSKGETIHLHLRAGKPPVIHGVNGVSVKASGAGHASHYYSMTRLATTGEFFGDGKSRAFRGESWFDHEWATNQLAPGQVGWDWFSVQFEDGTELMLYRMRLENGSSDPASSGTLIAADGTNTHLPSGAFQMTPTEFWKSDRSGAKYPIGWRVELPEQKLQFSVHAALENQELAIPPLVYWEGAIDVDGTRDGKAIKGRGYLELTGYGSPLRELQR